MEDLIMLIGVPKEIKTHEYRVGLVPASVCELVHQGHRVIVESGAGAGIMCDDALYEEMGATIVPSAKTIFEQADMIVKVKEPQPNECKMLRPGQVLFTYLHLAADKSLTDLLLNSGCIAISYETVTDDRGGLPLLAPMSEVAGRLSIQVGSHCLEKAQGGRGVLLGGVPGVSSGHVVIIGGGVSGMNAARMAIGQEARVTILDKSLYRLRELSEMFGSRINTVHATHFSVLEAIRDADLVVCAVLIPGAAAPKIITRDMLKEMQPGSVIVDISIDQGGCLETSRPTTHSDPTFIEENILHYCVTNMPGAVPRTSAFALNNATLPYTLQLANKGAIQAMRDNPHLMNGLNIFQGDLVHKAVADATGHQYIVAENVL
jgi:alanine dehydrogenase